MPSTQHALLPLGLSEDAEIQEHSVTAIHRRQQGLQTTAVNGMAIQRLTALAKKVLKSQGLGGIIYSLPFKSFGSCF